MRVWLVDDRTGDDPGSLEAILRQLERRPGGGLQFVGWSPFQADFVASMRKLVPDLVDLILIQERAWPEGPWTQEVLALGPALVVVAAAERVERFAGIAEQFPVSFVPPKASPEALWLALFGAFAGLRRQAHWRNQVEQLQQRLNDRIIIERAKGILVQRLSISEEEAYKRLRVLSRRQRRQIRDIAQSLLDTQGLFLPENNGIGTHAPDSRVHDPQDRLENP